MNKFVVSYDLMKEGQRYDLIIEFLEKLPVAIKVLGSCWLVKTEKSIEELSENINGILDNNDKFIVVIFNEYPNGILNKDTVEKLNKEF